MELDALWARHVLAAIGSGLIAVGFIALTFLAIWRPRSEEPGDKTGPGLVPWLGAFMPWALSVLAAGTLAFLVLWLVHYIREPPNW